MDRFIRSNVNVVRHEFERRIVSNIIRIPGKENLPDPGTKSDSPLTYAIDLTLFEGLLPFAFLMAEERSSSHPLG